MKFVKITDGVWGWISSMACFYVVLDDQQVIIIDCGLPWHGKKIKRFLEKSFLNKKNHLLLITHSDGDHIGSVYYLKKNFGLSVLMSKEAKSNFTNKKLTKHAPSLLYLVLKIIYKTNRTNVEINTLVKERGVLKESANFLFFKTPGHSSDHYCFYYKPKKVLFAGDMLRLKKNRLLPMHSFLNIDNSQLQKSLKIVSKLDIDYVCVGHGDGYWSKQNSTQNLSDIVQR